MARMMDQGELRIQKPRQRGCWADYERRKAALDAAQPDLDWRMREQLLRSIALELGL